MKSLLWYSDEVPVFIPSYLPTVHHTRCFSSSLLVLQRPPGLLYIAEGRGRCALPPLSEPLKSRYKGTGLEESVQKYGGEYPWCIATVPRQCSSTTHERSCLWHLTGSSVGRLKKSPQFIISALDSPILGLFSPHVYPSIKSYSLQKNQ